MRHTEILKARVLPEIRLRLKSIADREFLSESAWLRRIVIREILAAEQRLPSLERSQGVDSGEAIDDKTHRPRGTKRVYVRLCREDWLLLEARAAARGMRPATYISVLTRANLRSLTPLPKEELLALKRSIAELGAIGRNFNQIARAANSGSALPDSARTEFRAMLKICEALRDNTKSLLKANLGSWSSGDR